MSNNTQNQLVMLSALVGYLQDSAWDGHDCGCNIDVQYDFQGGGGTEHFSNLKEVLEYTREMAGDDLIFFHDGEINCESCYLKFSRSRRTRKVEYCAGHRDAWERTLDMATASGKSEFKVVVKTEQHKRDLLFRAGQRIDLPVELVIRVEA